MLRWSRVLPCPPLLRPTLGSFQKFKFSTDVETQGKSGVLDVAATMKKKKQNKRGTFVKIKGFDTELPELEEKKGINFDGIDLTKQNLLADVLAEKADAGLLTTEEYEIIERAVSARCANASELTKFRIENLVAKYQRFPGDTGSTEVQVAVLSERIRYLTEHTSKFRKDMRAKKDLDTLTNKRRTLMKYLKGHRFSKYELMLRDFNMTDDEIWKFGRIKMRKFFMSRSPGVSEWTGDKERRLKREAIAAEAAALLPPVEEAPPPPRRKKPRAKVRGLMRRRVKKMKKLEPHWTWTA